MRNVLMSHSSVGISWLFSSANYALDYIFSMNNGGSTKEIVTEWLDCHKKKNEMKCSQQIHCGERGIL